MNYTKIKSEYPHITRADVRYAERAIPEAELEEHFGLKNLLRQNKANLRKQRAFVYDDRHDSAIQDFMRQELPAKGDLASSVAWRSYSNVSRTMLRDSKYEDLLKGWLRLLSSDLNNLCKYDMMYNDVRLRAIAKLHRMLVTGVIHVENRRLVYS